MKNAVVYSRVASYDCLAVEFQKEFLRKFAEKMGYSVVGEFVDLTHTGERQFA